MKLLLFHPGAERVTCEQCRRFMVDQSTWKFKTFRAGAAREERLCARPRNLPPPCFECPKGPPRDAADSILTRRNARTLQLYLQVRATGGQCLTRRMRRNWLLMRNLTIIDGLYREWEASRFSSQIAAQTSAVFAQARML